LKGSGNFNILFKLTTATAEDASISDGVRTAKYAMLAIKYTTVTMEIDITIARGRFL
jgi:hypothetical protein